MFSALDHHFMTHALRLGEQGLATATPNPSVGCVLVKHDRIVGEGFHAKAGEPHAEVQALRDCTARGHDPQGATAYVTLEPCAHHGRTPPCVDALIAAKVSRVVAALEDPNPSVAGKGVAALRGAEIIVDIGLLAAQAEQLHRGFLSRMRRGRPWITAKMGASLDGKTALANGTSQWITSEEARRDVHRLRSLACAVLTGAGTLKSDNPRLTVRHVTATRQPTRIVIDSRFESPVDAAIFDTHEAPTWLIVVNRDTEKERLLAERGVRIITAESDNEKRGKSDLHAVMRRLGSEGINHLLVETGARLAGSLLADGLIDELVLYSAPSLLGEKGWGLFGIPELSSLDERIRLNVTDVRRIGPDIRTTALIER